MKNLIKIKNIDYLDIIFVFGIFISNFVFWNNADVVYEIPKVWFVLRWIEVLGLTSFIFGFWKLKSENLDIKLISLVLLFAMTIFISSFLGVDFNKSISGNYYRMDGIITVIHLLLLFFLIGLFSGINWLKGFVGSIFSSSLILSINNIILWFKFYILDIPVTNWFGAFGGPFGNPNFLAGYLIVSLPLSFYFLKFIFHIRLLAVFGLITILILGILTTYSWAGIFGILIFIFVLILMNIQKKYKYIFALFGVITLLLTSFIYTSQEKIKVNPNIVNPESRERIAMKGLIALKEKPVLGFGWANYDYAFSKVDYPIRLDNDVYVDKAHSSLLEVLVTTGILGFLFYVLIISKIALNLWKMDGFIYKYLFFAFVLLVLHMQTNIVSISEELIFWIIAGFSIKSNLSRRVKN